MAFSFNSLNTKGGGGGALAYDVNLSPGLGQTHRCSFDVVSCTFTSYPVFSTIVKFLPKRFPKTLPFFPKR